MQFTGWGKTPSTGHSGSGFTITSGYLQSEITCYIFDTISIIHSNLMHFQEEIVHFFPEKQDAETQKW